MLEQFLPQVSYVKSCIGFSIFSIINNTGNRKYRTGVALQKRKRKPILSLKHPKGLVLGQRKFRSPEWFGTMVVELVVPLYWPPQRYPDFVVLTGFWDFSSVDRTHITELSIYETRSSPTGTMN